MKKLFLILGLTLILIANVEASPTFLGSTNQLADDSYESVEVFSGGDSYIINNRSRENDVLIPDPDPVDSDKNNGLGYKYTDFTGYYIGTILGENDSLDDVLNLARIFLNDDSFGISDYSKTEVSDSGTISYDDPNSDVKIDVTVADDLKSGTWSIVNPQPDQAISFYSVKGGNEYALYYVNPALTTGEWITEHLLNNLNNLNNPTISHFSGVIASTPLPPPPGGTDAVPEPATMILLGFGLIGLAGIGRRTRKI